MPNCQLIFFWTGGLGFGRSCCVVKATRNLDILDGQEPAATKYRSKKEPHLRAAVKSLTGAIDHASILRFFSTQTPGMYLSILLQRYQANQVLHHVTSLLLISVVQDCSPAQLVQTGLYNPRAEQIIERQKHIYMYITNRICSGINQHL